jgi:hypothetical protein
LDIASGQTGCDETYWAYQTLRGQVQVGESIKGMSGDKLAQSRKRIGFFVENLLKQSACETAPIYLPEILKNFPFVSLQPVDLSNRLSRVLRVRPGQYVLQYPKGELKPQVRVSLGMDLSRLVFETERTRFPELGEIDHGLLDFEEFLFVANLLVPPALLSREICEVERGKNLIRELGLLFWVPQILVSFQLQEILKNKNTTDANNRLPKGIRPDQVISGYSEMSP